MKLELHPQQIMILSYYDLYFFEPPKAKIYLRKTRGRATK